MATRSEAETTLEELSFSEKPSRNVNTMEKSNGIEKENSKQALFEKSDLEQHFAFRDKILSRLETRKNSVEMKQIRQNEEAFRAATLAFLLTSEQTEEHKEDLSNGRTDKTEKEESTSPTPNKETDSSSTAKEPSLFEMIRRFLMFEIRYTVPALFNLTVYCLAYCGTYCLLNTVIVESAKNVDNMDLVYLLVLALSFFFARITGGIWLWVREETTKELEERKEEFEVFRRWRWWSERHHDLREMFNTLSFFMCFVGVFYFYQFRFLTPLDSRSAILEGLPSAQHGVATFYSGLLGTTSIPGIEMGTQRMEEACVASDGNVCETDFTSQDELYLRSQLSVDSYYGLVGESGTLFITATASILYAILVSLFSIALLKKRGLTFWIME